MPVSELFDPSVWKPVADFEALTDITYHHDTAGRVARIAFNRPEVRNAFRPHTVDELYRVLDDARQNSRIGVVLLTGNGPSAKDGGWAFCSGGDQRIRGRDGYLYEVNGTEPDAVEGGDDAAVRQARPAHRDSRHAPGCAGRRPSRRPTRHPSRWARCR